MDIAEVAFTAGIADESVYRPPARGHIGRRLSGVILASYEDKFPIDDPEKLAALNEMIAKFPAPPVMEQSPTNGPSSGGKGNSAKANNTGNNSNSSAPSTGSSGNNSGASSGSSGWSIKSLTASLFSKT